MSLTLLIDNDVVIKLARMGCFQEGLDAIGRRCGEVGSIKVMLRYMGVADERRRRRLCASQGEADRLQAALASIVEIELTEDEALTAGELMAIALIGELDLDEGELMLLVVALHRGSLDVATGDKRAILALPEMVRLAPSLSALQGHLICLEQIFIRMAQARGLAFVGRALALAPRADEAVAFVYHQVAGGDALRFTAALTHLVNEQLVRNAPGWLKPSVS